MSLSGCWFHGHKCRLTEKAREKHKNDKAWNKQQNDRLKRTRNREAFIRKHGYLTKSIWECEYETKVAELDMTLLECRNKFLPSFYNENRGAVTSLAILEAVRSEQLFGMLEVDIEVKYNINNNNNKPLVKLSK